MERRHRWGEALQGWVGLRNVLAHIYTGVDLDRLHAALVADKSALRDVVRIAALELTTSSGNGR